MNVCQQLLDTKMRTLARYSLDDDQLNRCYGPDKWSVRYILHLSVAKTGAARLLIIIANASRQTVA